MIPLARPSISEADIQAVTDVLRTSQLSLGPRLGEFEDAFCRYTGAACAAAVSSGTAALHLALRALGIGPGDEVITTPFSFVASANCVLFEKAQPVFVDVDRKNFNIDVEQIEARITERTKAILPVHVFGRPANMTRILDIARRHSLSVIEDSCEALGASWNGRHAGTLGDVGTFAFYPNKQITTGEGGMLITMDPDLDMLFKSLRNQGRGDDGAWLQHQRLGYNYRLSDLNCALGISQLKRVDQFLDQRRNVAQLYRQHLKGIEEIQLPVYEVENAQISWFVYVVQLRNATLETRNQLMGRLRDSGVECAPYFCPIHLYPHFQEMGYQKGQFPVTEEVACSTLALPFFNELREAEIRRVAQAVKEAVSGTAAPRVPTASES